MTRHMFSICSRKDRAALILVTVACMAILGVAMVADAGSPSPAVKGTAFVHTVVTGTGGNVCGIDGGATIIDHPLANGHPGAILLVMRNDGPTSATPLAVCLPSPPEVFYDDANLCGNALNRWVIIGCEFPGTFISPQSFNVLIVSP